MNRKTINLLLAILICISCEEEEQIIDPGQINLRVENISNQIFISVLINTGGAENTFDNLRAGQKSSYKVFSNAYRYGYIQVKTPFKEYVIQPIDYVGEMLLNPGKYTYRLDIVRDELTLTFSED